MKTENQSAEAIKTLTSQSCLISKLSGLCVVAQKICRMPTKSGFPLTDSGDGEYIGSRKAIIFKGEKC